MSISFNTEMDNGEIMCALLYNDQAISLWDQAQTVIGKERMGKIATHRYLIGRASLELIKERVFPLIQDPNYIFPIGQKANLLSEFQRAGSTEAVAKILFLLEKGALFIDLMAQDYKDAECDQILSAGKQFAPLKAKIAEAPCFFRYLLRKGCEGLLTGQISPVDVTEYLSHTFKKAEGFFPVPLRPFVDELPALILSFGIAREHAQNRFLLNRAMRDCAAVFEQICPHLSVSDLDEKIEGEFHPLRVALHHYMCEKYDFLKWSNFAIKLPKPEGAILTAHKVQAFIQQAQEDFRQAFKASQKENKPLLFIMGEFHYSALSWLYEQAVVDVAHGLNVRQLLVETDDEFVPERRTRCRIANWLTTDWITPTVLERGWTVLGVDVYHDNHDMELRDQGMAEAIAGRQSVAALQGDHFEREAFVKPVPTLAIVGKDHIASLKQKLDDHFYKFFVINDFRGEEAATKADVKCVAPKDLNPRYLFPDEVKSFYK